MASKGIDIQWDDSEATEQMRRQAKWLSPHELAKAGAAAINRAARTAHTHGARAVRGELALKQSTIKSKIKRSRATPANVEATLDFDYSPIPLKEYGARQIARGVSFRVKRSGGRQTMRQWFINNAIGGHAFRRKRSGDGRVPRLPIIKGMGPSVGSQLERARPVMDAKVEETIEKRMRHEIDRRVKRANR